VAPISQDLVWLDPGLRSTLAGGARVWLVAPSGHASLHTALASRLGSEGLPVQLSGPRDVGGVGFSQLSRP
jgi:hypothetical protein